MAFFESGLVFLAFSFIGICKKPAEVVIYEVAQAMNGILVRGCLQFGKPSFDSAWLGKGVFVL